MQNEEVLTLKEVSTYLKVSQESLRNLIRDRKIPVSKVGVQYRFQKSIIDLWLKIQALKSFESPGELVGEDLRMKAKDILSQSQLAEEEKRFLISLIGKIKPSPCLKDLELDDVEIVLEDEIEESVIL